MIQKKTALGIITWLTLSISMVREIELITSNPFGFFISLVFGVFFSYHIVAYIFGWNMLTVGGFQVRKGEHDFWRLLMFIFFTCLWLWSFFST